ncbi:YhjD/YihY/BrkB family envelope integrity protein [Pseudostreptobacillus hongkongensis]|uniref:YhjD/YihY/BrkB family envelope integrity protein n=1 Tax=Pseudostreptobacillus hongkongensis TaxID=1162717 RepID=UPI0028D12112|nr:YhjD/YihY/BrkB family envelope integrity protein [Pseudostreptobacillus hongkongensis]
MEKYFNKIVKISKIFIKNYFSSDLSLLASNLTYMMLLTIFPFFAIVLGISKGFGLDEIILKQLTSLVNRNETMLNYVIDVTNNIINTAKGGILTGLGVIILVYSVISMLNLLEDTFNNIWNVKDSRNYKDKLISYIAIVFIAPLFIFLIIASSSFILNILMKYFGNIPFIAQITVKILNGLLSIIFILGVFVLIPNKRVQFIPALIGSILTYAGLIIIYNLYMLLQTSISNYNLIYGSLAFVPIFLIWIKYVWTVILIGSQITYSIQTSREFVEERYTLSLSSKKRLGLYLMYILIERFENDEDPYTITDLKIRTSLPKSVIREGIRVLQSLVLINEVFDSKLNVTYYQINKNPDVLNVETLNNMIEGYSIDDNEIYSLMNDDKKEEYEKIINEIIFENKKLVKDI